MSIDIKQEDVDAFNVKLVELLKEYNFTLGSEALIMDGRIVTKVVVLPKKVVVAPKVPKVEEEPKKDDKKGK